MIKGLLGLLIVFLLATFPATWLLMLFMGNVGLAVGKTFIISADGKAVDPAYLKIMAPETLVVISQQYLVTPGPEAPAPMLIPGAP